jgi:hypothetical protein
MWWRSVPKPKIFVAWRDGELVDSAEFRRRQSEAKAAHEAAKARYKILPYPLPDDMQWGIINRIAGDMQHKAALKRDTRQQDAYWQEFADDVRARFPELKSKTEIALQIEKELAAEGVKVKHGTIRKKI